MTLKVTSWPEAQRLLPASRRVPTVQSPRRVARYLTLGLVAFFLFAGFAPWRQNISGAGQVIAFSPDERPQEIQAPISGRVSRWHVMEGQQVEEGQLLVELSDNDPDRLARIEGAAEAARARLEAYEQREIANDERLEAVRRSQRAQIRAAEAEIATARESLAARRGRLAAARASLETARIQLTRIEALSEQGLSSSRDLELSQLAQATAQAEIEALEADVRGAQGNLQSKQAYLSRVRATTEADIRSAIASLESARTEVASARSSVLSAETALAQQAQQTVRAPRDGVVQRISVQQGQVQVSRGTTLATLVPASNSRAVAISIDGNDASLISPGRQVRLQFEGWPGLQFSGWPSVAVGTFAGRVSFVDPADRGTGDFRVVVVPDEGEEWPDAAYLRQGTRVKGWILLEEVRVGFELWRQLNGFPPALDQAPSSESYEN